MHYYNSAALIRLSASIALFTLCLTTFSLAQELLDTGDNETIANDDGIVILNDSASAVVSNDSGVLALDDDIVIIDGESFEITVKQRTVATLSPSSRIIRASEFRGKFADLPSVLESVSGVDMRSMGGYGQYAESSIRGGGALGVRVYLDGALLNGASVGAVDLSKIPLSQIQEIRITKNVSGLKRMGDGMGGTIELFSIDEEESSGAVSINLETGSFGYLKGGIVVKTGAKSANHKQNDTLTPAVAKVSRFRHQINIDVLKSDNDYPFTHDNGTTIPTAQQPDPTFDDTLMRKNNNYYRSIDGAYSASYTLAKKHLISHNVRAGAYRNGLFVYYYKDNQSGETGGRALSLNTDYSGEITPEFTLNASIGGVYRGSNISDPSGHFLYSGVGRYIKINGGSADFLLDAQYALFDFFSLAATAATRFERYVQDDNASSVKPDMSRYSYKTGLGVSAKAQSFESVLNFVLKYEIDTTDAGLGFWSSDGKRYDIFYPCLEATFGFDLTDGVKLQFGGAVSKRSPTFFERFGWSGSFVPNPDLKEETRREVDAGISFYNGAQSVAASVFMGRIGDKIKSIPRNNFVKAMNFADTEFYGAELDIGAKLMNIFSIELSAAHLKSVIDDAADKSWIGKYEPFVPELSGFIKTEADILKFNIGHIIKYESACYINIENRNFRPQQSELGVWASYKIYELLLLRYRVDNYLNTANFDFLDNPKPRRTHTFSLTLNF